VAWRFSWNFSRKVRGWDEGISEKYDDDFDNVGCACGGGSSLLQNLGWVYLALRRLTVLSRFLQVTFLVNGVLFSTFGLCALGFLSVVSASTTSMVGSEAIAGVGSSSTGGSTAGVCSSSAGTGSSGATSGTAACFALALLYAVAFGLTSTVSSIATSAFALALALAFAFTFGSSVSAVKSTTSI